MGSRAFLMSASRKGAPEYASCGRLNEISKKGVCWSELKRTDMAQWGACRRLRVVCEDAENDTQLSSTVVKEECAKDDESVPAGSAATPETRKRKRVTPSLQKEMSMGISEAKTNQKAAKDAKQRLSSSFHKRKQTKPGDSTDRWSTERYKMAEKSMFEVMKAEGAVFDNPICRAALRLAARKRIGDTGLLDHLLKDIDGHVAPGGSERFRRCYNTNGVMEYWLESADLVKAGGADSKRFSPSLNKSVGGPFHDPDCAGEVKLLQAEVARLKRDMQELVSTNREKNQANSVEEMHNELIKLEASTSKRLMEISTSLSGMQEMYRDFVLWKDRIGQQVTDISTTVNSLQASNQHTSVVPTSERWEDWLESTNLDNIPCYEFASWVESTDLINIGSETELQQPCSAPQAGLKPVDGPSQDLVCIGVPKAFKEDMAWKRDGLELGHQRIEEDHATVTPDSSITANSKIDLDTSCLLFQEMLKELVKWKANMEQQLVEISSSVTAMQASK
ncbi:hypothetical protein HS088_TW22G01326 [Tripterygium wilfordii]|uniref:PTC1-like winged helix-turn-helix domain-containing protein n=1 Tax=Tripterygium wilfordii TaxID=458696 RepID=A0A7J7C0E4_TRIWF|nr:hypothetical protein HS088_TW22G01326 [Tripterygium wilfordii]